MTEERTLGPTETRLLNCLAADGQVVFSTAQARAALDDEDQDVNKLLYRLTRKRWLLRLEKGKYLLLPLEAGTEGSYTVHEFVIAAHLVQRHSIAYASAFAFHGLFDLVPETLAPGRKRLARSLRVTALKAPGRDRLLRTYTEGQGAEGAWAGAPGANLQGHGAEGAWAGPPTTNLYGRSGG